ncbi:MAG TPA: class I SAM-dependent methyltransferase [Planctomycetes bacterium]|nr:class I SAM-dependent methyltransferase [Planctomycetota bacterium]HIK59611.1 class I SAM-dependent methyltransferase [Planctomycetota bacterium]
MCPSEFKPSPEAIADLRFRARKARERGDRVAGDQRLEQNLEPLLREGNQIWETFIEARGGTFHHLIPADAEGAYQQLRQLRDRHHTFLELGSGMGVITILADLLGFEAHGIEIEEGLVDLSRDLAERHGSSASFTQGSFVPVDFRDEVHLLDGEFHTIAEGTDAYGELGMELSEFDLVYAYPWPGEEEWLADLFQRAGGGHAQLLTYSVSEGYSLSGPFGDPDPDW